MPKPHLSDNQINQLFFINEQGFLCRKEITGFMQMTSTSKLMWNQKANQPISALRIRITGYKEERTRWIKDVLLHGREVADKNADAIRRENCRNKPPSTIGVQKHITYIPKTGMYLVCIGSKNKVKFKSKANAISYLNSILAKNPIKKIDKEDELEEMAEPYDVDNTDLFIPDFVDNSANNQVRYLSVYG